jgi:SRSO17 transposase
VPKNFLCWPTLPACDFLQGPFAAKRVDNAVTWGKPFRKRKWRTFHLGHRTEGPAVCKAKAGRVHLVQNGRPTTRKYWLIVAQNVKIREVEYFVSNAPPKTALRLLLRVTFQRWNVEHAFRVAKSEIGFTHYEGRSYHGLMRHMTLCQLVMLFLTEHTARLREEKSGANARTDRAGAQHGLPLLARPPPQTLSA